MKEQLITEITRQMLPYLDNYQMEQLQEPLAHCFWGVQVSPEEETDQILSCWICSFQQNV